MSPLQIVRTRQHEPAHGLAEFFAGRQKAFPGTVPSPKGEARKSLLRVQPDRWVGPTLRKERSKTK